MSFDFGVLLGDALSADQSSMPSNSSEAFAEKKKAKKEMKDKTHKKDKKKKEKRMKDNDNMEEHAEKMDPMENLRDAE